MFTPLPILPYTRRPLYTDNPAAHNVSAISPLDPQLFTSIDQHRRKSIRQPDARYNTREVIAWLEALVATSTKGLDRRRDRRPAPATPEFRRAEEDILILNGLGPYYANLFRAALSLHHLRTDQLRPARSPSMPNRKRARCVGAAWPIARKAIYAADISYGSTAFRRGHWADRLAAIDADLRRSQNTSA